MTNHETYMQRCLELAKLAAGHVAPNPMVGAVLVADEKIIGEGYHHAYGEPHAEVNCIASVRSESHHLIPSSRLYVSLEPCAHFGKTPPCADMIIAQKIQEVVIGCKDPFAEVNGMGIKKLIAAGIKVETGILEKESIELNKRFFTFHRQHRPYIILKWAQTADSKIANENYSRIRISNEITNRLVHKWRSEEASVLVGTNTALLDDPQLTNRSWNGNDPVRLVIDLDLRLPSSLHIFDKKVKTIIFNTVRHEEKENLIYYQVTREVSLVHQVTHALYQLKILSVVVEGGTILLQSFIDEDHWDEARIITNEEMIAGPGINAPVISHFDKIDTERSGTDRITILKKYE